MASSIGDILPKAPFANYDIVVYFGGGLFFIPFINRYMVEPFSLKWPQFKIEIGSNLAQESVSILSLVFAIYILGHMLAYVGSHFIEKLCDRILGKVSTAIVLSSYTNFSNRNDAIRALCFSQITRIRREKALISTLVRSSLHVPLIPLYLLLFAWGTFGYFSTRVTPEVLSCVRRKMSKTGISDLPVSARSKWYKPIEYYVINKIPNAVPRMYNYLVISGLFRTISLIFLMSVFVQAYFVIHYLVDGEIFLKPFLGKTGLVAHSLEIGLAMMLYIFCLFSYLKFQRRYAEEAIFAFAFD